MTYAYGPNAEAANDQGFDLTSTTKFEYDATGRMTKVAVEYKYDHNGFRVERTQGRDNNLPRRPEQPDRLRARRRQAVRRSRSWRKPDDSDAHELPSSSHPQDAANVMNSSNR